MHRVQQYIERGRAQLLEHPFHRTLAANAPLTRVTHFVPQVAFFIFAFQDMMATAGEQASDPRVRDLLRRHCAEELGHEQWYLKDAAVLTGGIPELTIVFSAQHARTRRAAYALMTELLSA